MNQAKLVVLACQLEATYREFSRAAAMLSDVRNALAEARDLPDSAMADRCAPLADDVVNALTLAGNSAELCAVAATLLYPKNK